MSTTEQLTPKAIYEMVAEVGFCKYFHFGGFQASGIPFHVASYVKGKGVRLPGNGYRYQAILGELKSFPRDRDSYGLIHSDFNDGNFIVDYSNGDITVFDFDDSCYFWFAYELAAAWERGIGRTMFQGLKEREAFMSHFMEQVMTGYNLEYSLSDEWMAHIPFFIQLIQVEEFLHFAQYIDEPDEELQAELNYKIKCIEDETPYMGFFDSIYSPERPFSLLSKAAPSLA